MTAPRQALYRPTPLLVGPVQAIPFDRPPLVQFVVLSMLVHALFVLLFGAPSGGTQEGRAMWGALQVVIRESFTGPAPELKLDRGLGSLPQPRAPEATPQAAPPPVTLPSPPPPLPPLDLGASKKLDLPPGFQAQEVPPTPAPTPEPSPPQAVPTPVEPPIEMPRLMDRLSPPKLNELAPPLQIPPPPPPAPAAAPQVEPPVVLPVPQRMEPLTPSRVSPIEVPPMPAIERAPAPVPAPPVVEPPVTLPVPTPMAPITPSRTSPIEVPPLPALEPTPAARVPSPPVDTRPVEVPAVPVLPADKQPVRPSQVPDRGAPSEFRPSPTQPAPPERATTQPPVQDRMPPREPADRGSPFGAPDRKSDIFTDKKGTPPGGLDLDAMKRRAGELARGAGNRAPLPFPMPAEPERKTKEQIAIENARKPDCKTTWQGLGLLAIVPLIANEVGEGNCTWNGAKQ